MGFLALSESADFLHDPEIIEHPNLSGSFSGLTPPLPSSGRAATHRFSPPKISWEPRCSNRSCSHDGSAAHLKDMMARDEAMSYPAKAAILF